MSYDYFAITCCMRILSWLQLWKLIFSDRNTSPIVTFYEIPQRNSNISRRLMALLSWKSIEIKSGEFMIFILWKKVCFVLAPVIYNDDLLMSDFETHKSSKLRCTNNFSNYICENNINIITFWTTLKQLLYSLSHHILGKIFLLLVQKHY